jgi:hypothetical protein
MLCQNEGRSTLRPYDTAYLFSIDIYRFRTRLGPALIEP